MDLFGNERRVAIMQRCSTCNRTYPDDAPGFCPQDGTRLTSTGESSVNCQKCGYMIPNNVPFCANCGSPRQAVSHQPQQSFQPTPSQPQANHPVGYIAQQPYRQNPQAPYAAPTQYPRPTAKRKIAAWQIIAAIIFMLLGLFQILRGLHVLR